MITFLLTLLVCVLGMAAWIVSRYPMRSLIFAGALAGIGVIVYQHNETLSQLGIVPEGMPIENILHVENDYREFYEPVIIVYELPDNVAREIQKNGLGYFTKLPKISAGRYDRHGCCSHWESTPMVGNRPEDFFPDVRAYLSRSGFEGRIDLAVEREINTAVSGRGSYYARDNSGTFLVIPDNRKIIYVRND